MIVLTLGANIKIARTDPALGMTAFFADETIGPFLFKQIIVTSLGI
jgi:hypothetical protein